MNVQAQSQRYRTKHLEESTQVLTEKRLILCSALIRNQTLASEGCLKCWTNQPQISNQINCVN